MKKYSLAELVEAPISGEWGVDPVDRNGVKIIRTTNFTNEGRLDLSNVVVRDIEARKVEKKRLQFGDIIIEKSGGSPTQPVGRVVFFDVENELFLCNNFTAVLRTKKEVYPKYLFYLMYGLHLTKATLTFQNKTTGIINLKLNDYLNKIEIPLPPLAEQKRIAEVLDKADRLRQKDRQLLQKYDQLLQSVFQDMFGDPNPDSKSWEAVPIMELAAKEKGSMRTGPFGSDLLHSEFVDEGVFVLGIDNVVCNSFEWGKARYITEQKYEKLKRYKVYPGDVLISIMATVGRTAVVPDNIPEAINSKHLAAITLNRNLADPVFMSYSLHSDPYVVNQLSSQNRGAIMNGLNLGIIKETKIKLPPLAIQNRFSEIATSINHQKALVEATSIQSESFFQSLLQKAFKGELALKEMEPAAALDLV